MNEQKTTESKDELAKQAWDYFIAGKHDYTKTPAKEVNSAKEVNCCTCGYNDVCPKTTPRNCYLYD